MRLDPLTIPYRGFRMALQWAVGVGMIGLLATRAFDLPVDQRAVTVAVIAAGFAGIGWSVAFYRRFEFELTAESLDITSGIVARRTREIPLGRIQNVDIRQGAIPRLLGVAEVRFETAGGRGTEASLQYVNLAVARKLQEQVDRHGETVEVDDLGTPADEAEPRPVQRPVEEPLYAITPVELGLLSVTTVDWRAVGFIVLVAVGVVPDAGMPGFDGSPLTPLVLLAQPLLLTMAGVLGNGAVLTARFFRFRLWRTGETLRYERGLIRRFSGSIPLDRVHLLRLRDNPLTRGLGYAALDIQTAGYGPETEGGSAAAVPIARRDRVVDLAGSIEPVPDLDIQRPPSRARRRYTIRYAVVAALAIAGLYAIDLYLRSIPWYFGAVLLVLAPVAAHLTWKHRGYALGEHALVVRAGFWRRTTAVIPLFRVQTVGTTATIFQRRWSLATLRVDTAGGAPAAYDLDSETARRLREAVTKELLLDRVRRRDMETRQRNSSS